MKTDILPTGGSGTSKILPVEGGNSSKILPETEKTPSILPDEVKAWNGCISSGRSTLVAGVVAALLTLALFAFSVLSPARLTRDLTRRYWIQQDPQSAQQVGSAPYKVTSFRTIEMGDTTIKLDIFNHTMKADPSMVTGTPTEMWYEGY